MKFERFFEGMVNFSAPAKAELIVGAIEEDSEFDVPPFVTADLHILSRTYRDQIDGVGVVRSEADRYFDEEFERLIESNTSTLISEAYIGVFARSCAASVTNSFALAAERNGVEIDINSLLALASRRALLKGSMYTTFSEGKEIDRAHVSGIYSAMIQPKVSSTDVRELLYGYVQNKPAELS